MMNHRRAFTLIELLIVIAIIGILIAAIAVAVTKAKELANVRSCGYNMRNIGVALKMHEQEKGYYPASLVNSANKIYFGTGTKSWVPDMLLYLEQRGIPYDQNVDWNHMNNKAAMETPMRVLQCPATVRSSETVDVQVLGGSSAKAFVNDYAPCSAVAGTFYTYNNIGSPKGLGPPDKTAVLRQNAYTKSSEITDGTMYSMMVTEDAGRPMLWRKGKPYPGSTSGNGAWTDMANEYHLHGSVTSNWSQPGPCAINCSNANEIYSFHSGGVNCVFADAGVRFISESINLEILAALITKAGEDVADFE